MNSLFSLQSLDIDAAADIITALVDVLPFSRSPVLPFSRSPVLPFSRSPVLPFSKRDDVNFGGKVESGRQKHEMAASVALGDGDLQNIPSGVHNMRTVLDATSDAEATQEQALGIDRLAVIVPVYNEERTVAELLRCLEAQPCVSQIVIVDDGSTDRTWEELAPWRARASFAGTVPVPDGDSFSAIVVQHDKNRGKGRAIRTGLDLVKCSHVLIQDADLEYNPGDISTLWQVMQSEQVDVVYGSRYLNLPNLQRGRFILQSGVRFLNLVTWFVYGVSLTDEATWVSVHQNHN